MTQTLIVKEDGSIVGPYAEVMMPKDLSEALGEVTMRRATDIIWDDIVGLWCVYVHGMYRREAYLFNNPSREACLAWERDMLERNYLRWARKNDMSGTYFDGSGTGCYMHLAKQYDIYDRLAAEPLWNYERWVLLNDLVDPVTFQDLPQEQQQQ